MEKSNNTGSVVEQLYLYYKDAHAGDSKKISKEFDRLDAVLNELKLQDYDRVWDISCKLCAMHEQEGFDAGLRTGMRLAIELGEEVILIPRK